MLENGSDLNVIAASTQRHLTPAAAQDIEPDGGRAAEAVAVAGPDGGRPVTTLAFCALCGGEGGTHAPDCERAAPSNLFSEEVALALDQYLSVSALLGRVPSVPPETVGALIQEGERLFAAWVCRLLDLEEPAVDAQGRGLESLRAVRTRIEVAIQNTDIEKRRADQALTELEAARAALHPEPSAEVPTRPGWYWALRSAENVDEVAGGDWNSMCLGTDGQWYGAAGGVTTAEDPKILLWMPQPRQEPPPLPTPEDLRRLREERATERTSVGGAP